MGYPNAPNFNIAEPFSAWWAVITGNVNQLNAPMVACATQGMSFIKRLQRRLGVSETGAWDQATADALAASINRDAVRVQFGDGAGQMNDQMRHDASTQTISESTLRYAIWYSYLRAPEGVSQPLHSYDAVRLSQNTVFPRFGVAADNDLAFGAPDGGATCWDPATQPAPTANLPATRPGQTSSPLTGRTAGDILFRNAQTGDIDPLKSAAVIVVLGALGYGGYRAYKKGMFGGKKSAPVNKKKR